MKKINIPLLNKGNLKIALAIIGIAIGLLLTSVFVFDKINYDNKVVSPINAQNCGSGTFTWHNCTACYKVYSCGGSLTYDCGSICLNPSCGAKACSCDGVCNVSTPAGYRTTNNSCSTTSVNGTHDCGQSCSVTFYRERYAINLTENGGTGTNCKDYTTTTGPCGGTANTAFGCTRSGYTLSSYTQSGCGGTWNSATGVCSSVTAAMSVTANWTANTYYVYYDANGGTGAPPTTSFAYNSTAYISSTIPTRTGYNFVNWTYSTYTFNPGDQIPIGWGTFTLTAQWAIKTFSVAYALNPTTGGAYTAPATRPPTINYGSPTPTATVSTNAGYTWNTFTQSGCGGTFTASTGVCSSVTAAMTITANWNINVTVNANSGTCTNDDHKRAPGAASLAPGCTRTGYTLTSYTLTAGTCGGTFTAATGVCSSVTAPITVTANWLADTFQVTVDATGGSCNPGTHNVNNGSASSAQSCTRTGYTLAGFTQTGCGGTFNTSTGVCSSVTQAMSITASWTLNAYQVTVNANSGSCNPGTHPVNHGSASTSQSCTRTGYTFNNFTVTTGTCGGTFTASTGVCSSVTGAITITAGWTNIAPTFTTNPAEATASTSAVPTSIGSSITFNATATDANASYYLIICSTNSVTPGSGGAAPSCGGTKYCNSTATASGTQASCSYTTISGNAWSNAWYGFVCDNNTDSKCSTSSQGLGDTGSPFFVNHIPSFTVVNNNSPQDPGSSVTWTTTASDPDGNTIKLLVCKTTGISTGACDGGAGDTWCSSSLSASNPTCSFAIPTPTPDGENTAYVYFVDQFNLAASGEAYSTTSNFTVSNVAPVVTSVTLNSGNSILLTENVNTNVTITATVTDGNSCSNGISSVLASAYRSGIGYLGCDISTEANGSYCYPEISCTVNGATCTGLTDPSADYTCNLSLQYYADPTDVNTEFPSENWLTSVKATDDNSATHRSELPVGVELNSLPASSNDPTVQYGFLNIEMIISPLSKVVTISSTGNVGVDHTISGTNLCTNYPFCTGGTPIAVTNQRYSLSSSTPYFSGTELTTSAVSLPTHLPKQRTSTKTTKDTMWGISIPTGIISGNYNGEVFLVPVKSATTYW